MDEWVYWMIAAGLLAAGEIFTMGFFLGPVALAGLVAAMASLAGAGLAVQFVVFTLTAVASLVLLRPIARRHMHTPPSLRTGTAALVGEGAVVLERVSAESGEVKIGGEVWTARSYDEDAVLEPGTRAEVMKIDGATALVAE